MLEFFLALSQEPFSLHAGTLRGIFPVLHQEEGVPGKENSIRNGTEIGKCYGNLKKNEHSFQSGWSVQVILYKSENYN